MASRHQNVIDLSSSPEPPIHLMSHPRPKFRSNQKHRTRTIPLELTDSDSDTEDAPNFLQTKKTSEIPLAGPSFHSIRTAALQQKIGPSGSFENIPNTTTRNLKASTARPFPLFLPSDEENEPPSPSFIAVSPVVERTSSFELVDMENVQPVELPEPIEVVPVEPEADPTSTYVARVLEIIPDVDPDHLLELVTKNIPTHGDQVVEHVLHCLFEDPTYPKLDKKGKGKRRQLDGDTEGDGTPAKKTKIDYRNKDRPYRGGVHYADIALVIVLYLILTTIFVKFTYLGTSTKRLSVYPESLSQDDACDFQWTIRYNLLFLKRSRKAVPGTPAAESSCQISIHASSHSIPPQQERQNSCNP